MAPSAFLTRPDRIQRDDVTVMQQTTVDDLPHIQALWPSFEKLVGLRGRKMYARVDLQLNAYTACTPLHDDDDPGCLGLELGTLAGGWYLRGRLTGEPPGIYEQIAAAMTELQATMPGDDARPLVEFYRRRDQIDLWLPIQP
jgi:hypothetical protein